MPVQSTNYTPQKGQLTESKTRKDNYVYYAVDEGVREQNQAKHGVHFISSYLPEYSVVLGT